MLFFGRAPILLSISPLFQVLFLTSAFQVLIMPGSFFVPLFIEKIGRRPMLLIGTSFHIVLPLMTMVAKCLDDKLGPNEWSILLGGASILTQGLSSLSGHSTVFLVLIADILPTGAKTVVSQVNRSQ